MLPNGFYRFGILIFLLAASAVKAECISACAKVERLDDKLVITVLDVKGNIFKVDTITGVKDAKIYSDVKSENDSTVQTLLYGARNGEQTTFEDGGTAPNPDNSVGGNRIEMKVVSETTVVYGDGTHHFITVFAFVDTVTGDVIGSRIVEEKIKPPPSPPEEIKEN